MPSSVFNHRGQLWSDKPPRMANPEREAINQLIKVNAFVKATSPSADITNACSERLKELIALRVKLEKRNWNGITTTESFNQELFRVAKSLDSDFPSEAVVLNSARARRGFVSEFLGQRRIGQRSDMRMRLNAALEATKPPMYKSR